MKHVWRQHPYLTSAFLIASAVTLFFLIRIASQAIYWSDPDHHRQQVRPWMTVGYVARSWDLHGPEIDQTAGLPLPDGHPKTLQEIARERGVPVADVIKQVEDAVALLVARKALK